jgi:hypothetical protein
VIALIGGLYEQAAVAVPWHRMTCSSWTTTSPRTPASPSRGPADLVAMSDLHTADR